MPLLFSRRTMRRGRCARGRKSLSDRPSVSRGLAGGSGRGYYKKRYSRRRRRYLSESSRCPGLFFLHGLHSARDGGRQAVHPPGSCRWGKPVGGESLVAYPVAISWRVSLNYVCVHLVMTDGLKRPRKSLRRPNKSWRRLDTVEKTPEWPGV